MIRSVLGLVLLLSIGLIAVPLIDIQVAGSDENNNATFIIADLGFDDNVSRNELGVAQIVFTPDDIYVETLGSYVVSPQFMLAESESIYEIKQEWQSLHTEEVEGEGFIELLIWVRSPDDDEYSLRAEDKGFFSSEDDAIQRDVLIASLEFEEAGYYDLRLETRIEASQPDQEPKVQEMEIIASLIVFPPLDFEIEETDLPIPEFGILAENGIVMDWRGWRGGFCELNRLFEDELDDNFQAGFTEACRLFQAENWNALGELITGTLPQIEPAWVAATVYDQAGIVAANLDEWDLAVQFFEEAKTRWIESDDPFSLSISLHNLMVAQSRTEDFEATYTTLEQLSFLRDQLGDEVGSVLTWTQVTIFAGDFEEAYNMIDWMAEFELPQAEALRGWVEAQVEDE